MNNINTQQSREFYSQVLPVNVNAAPQHLRPLVHFHNRAPLSQTRDLQAHNSTPTQSTLTEQDSHSSSSNENQLDDLNKYIKFAGNFELISLLQIRMIIK